MFREIVKSLTPEQKKLLAQAGIPSPRIAEWNHGKGYPTAVTARALAIVAGVDYGALMVSIAEEQATPEQRSFFRRALEAAPRATAVAIAAISLANFAAPSPAAADKHRGSVYYVNSLMRRAKKAIAIALAESIPQRQDISVQSACR